MAVFVPQTGRCQDQVAPTHRTFLAIDCGVGTFAFDDHAHGIGRVAVRRCPFAGQQQLHAQVHGGAGLHLLQPVAGVGQHQHAALGLFDRGQLARLQQQRAQDGIGPHGGLGAGQRFVRRQHGAQAGPQGHQVVLRQRVAVVLGQVFQSAKFLHRGLQ